MRERLPIFKNDDTWRLLLRHCDAGFDTARIEHSRGSGLGGNKRNMAGPERQPERARPELERSQAQAELQLVGQQVESQLPVCCASSPQLFSFLPRPQSGFGGVLLYKLPLPTAQHPPCLLYGC